MKNNDAICNQAIQRATSMRIRKQTRALKRYSACTLLLMLGLSVSIFKTIEFEITQHIAPQLAYGTGIYTNNEVGAYVTVGVAMFVAGVVFTIVCMKLKEKEE